MDPLKAIAATVAARTAAAALLIAAEADLAAARVGHTAARSAWHTAITAAVDAGASHRSVAHVAGCHLNRVYQLRPVRIN